MLLGIAGSWLAGVLGRSMGWYQPGEGAGLVGSVIGALIILFIYNRLVARRTTTTI
ncbi:MAG: GlsB/YeaQ/YmgE family stress response membrane protein [Gemmatimonadales bacterium]